MRPSVEDLPPREAKSARCLLVDDSRFDRRHIRSILKRTEIGMDVVEARSLTEARQILFDMDVDMILLDNNLPDGTGLAYAHELASDGRLNRIPVVMISGDPTEPLAERAAMAGCSAFVSKNELSARGLGHIVSSLLIGRDGPKGADMDAMHEMVLSAVTELMGEFSDQMKGPLTRCLRISAGVKHDIRGGERRAALEGLERLEEIVIAMQGFLEDAQRAGERAGARSGTG